MSTIVKSSAGTRVTGSGDVLSYKSIFFYALPPVGCGYMFCLVNLYLMKYATDVLLIAPAIMGAIFGISRLWDAVSDPLVGYLSDKTTSRWGRRRPWILMSIIPIAASFWMLFAAPAYLDSFGLVIWMSIAVIGFYSAQTIFIVPHMSLGAELTTSYYERNKIFGGRHAGWIIGYTTALVTMFLLIRAEAESVNSVRSLAVSQSILVSVITGVLLYACVRWLRERPEFLGRAPRRPFDALMDVCRNPHARLLLLVNFIENIGGASITILSLYNAQYVMNNAAAAPFFILSYMIFSFALVPIWIPLARRFGKKSLWLASLLVTGFAFLGIGFLSPGDELILIGLAGIAGAAGGCGGTVGPSIKSDIIDYDEYQTGERKEGAYFAAWNFVAKSAYGIMLMVTGFALSIAGFVPNVEQEPAVIFTLRFLYGGIPFITYLIGAGLFLRFAFNEAEYKVVRDELDTRLK